MKKHILITIGLLAMALLGSWRMPAGRIDAASKLSQISAILDTTFLNKEAGQDAFLKEYQRLTGIALKVTQPSHNQYNDRLLIAFASGDIPDVIEIQPEHLEVYMQLAREGAIIPLDRYIASSQALQKIDPVFFEAVKFRGKVYGVPVNRGGGCVTYIRKDWLDNLGLKVPTTWEELYNVAKAFTFQDPDGNGKNDTIGFTLPGLNTSYYVQDFYQGADHDFIRRNGKWVDGFTQPDFKAALARLRQAYEDRVIDPEIFTNKTSTCREKFNAGKVGIFSYWSGIWGETMDRNVKMQNPKGEVIALPAIKETTYLNRIAMLVAITNKAKNPQAVFDNFIQYMHDGGEGQMLFTHGVEGVHWAERDGKTVKLPSLVNPNNLFVKAFIDPLLALAPFRDPIPMKPREIASVKAHQSRVQQMKLPPDSDTYLKFASEIGLLKEEIMAKVVLGQYTVDQGLQIYQERARALRVDVILKEANAK